MNLKQAKKHAGSALLIIVVLIMASCSNAVPPQSEYVIGTYCTINLYNRGRMYMYQDLFKRLREIDNRMSMHIPDSDIDRINRNAGIQPVRVHDDTLSVLLKARDYAEISGGTFDISIGPLVSLWGIGSDYEQLPDAEVIEALLPLVDWQQIEIDTDQNLVFLKEPGMQLDLGAIAKGYAADEMAEMIRNFGVPRAIIDLGGNIIALGSKNRTSPWRIGIQDPSGQRGSYLGVVEVRDKTVVTSGVYERFFVEDGIVYHHILSTKNGYPVRNSLLSVTIIADTSMDADALSTAVFALGYEKGLALIEALSGVEAVFVFENYSVRLSSGIGDTFTLMNTRFSETGPVPSQK